MPSVCLGVHPATNRIAAIMDSNSGHNEAGENYMARYTAQLVLLTK
jgi:hypothetical protein